jgi:hypothetical protein
MILLVRSLALLSRAAKSHNIARKSDTHRAVMTMILSGKRAIEATMAGMIFYPTSFTKSPEGFREASP